LFANAAAHVPDVAPLVIVQSIPGGVDATRPEPVPVPPPAIVRIGLGTAEYVTPTDVVCPATTVPP
jgi:hypothetical protein